MHRTTLDFLKPMFPFSDFYNFSVLIINQTTPEKLLLSEYPEIKVINSFETGLSKSRNLALQHATGKILLIADDDVKYIKGFDEAIINFYNANPMADIAFFKTLTPEGKPYSAYKNTPTQITSCKNLVPVLSIELTFRRASVEGVIRFNELFGLGAKFEDAETLFFLRAAMAKRLKLFFCPEYVVVHKAFSSSDDVVSDRVLYARSAGYYKRFGWLSYFYVLKYVLFLLRKQMIPLRFTIPKLKTGLSGINDYKQCLREKKDTLYG